MKKDNVSDLSLPKKRKPLAVRILLGILIFIAALLVLISVWICFSALDKKSSISRIPEDFTIVLHSDSIYDGLSPVIDLKAADALLAEPSFASYRGVFMQARALLKDSSKLMKKVISRRADLALYEENQFAVVVDLSYLSAVTRLSSLFGNFIASKVNGLDFDSSNKIFVFTSGESRFLIRFEKNLAVVSANEQLFQKTYNVYKNDDLSKAIGGKSSGEIKIIANARKTADSFLEGNDTAEKLISFVKDDSLTSVAFSISNDDIDLNLNLPLNLSDDSSAVARVLSNKSTAPMIFSRLSDDTQYYTLLNLSTLDNLLQVASELMPEKNLESLLQKADSVSRSLFSLSLDELLFEWTGNEIAVLGLHDSNAPVFAVQVRDEKKLRSVLDTLDKSILINANTSLIIGGMRLPCLELPPVFVSLISVFGYDVPRPYYLLQNGFIYFSMSPQNLSAVYSRAKENSTLAKNIAWRDVSKKMDSKTSFSVYYDLKRSLPFFIDGDSPLSKILSLYNLGRCDLKLENNTVYLHLHAVSSADLSSRAVEGFPIKTGRIAEFATVSSSNVVFWLEDNKIRSLDLQNMQQSELNISEKHFITSGVNGTLWAASESGNIYLFDKNLSPKNGFPIITGNRFVTKGTFYADKFYVPSSSGDLICTDENGEFTEIPISPYANFRSAPAVSSNGVIALYSRGFEGEIYLIENGICINENDPLVVDGIGFGSPLVDIKSKNLSVAFITQAGDFYLFDKDGNMPPNFPIETGDVFYSNVVSYDGAYFAVSENALVYKITSDGKFFAVQLPDTASAKEGIISVSTEKGSEGIYVSGDNNILFAFDSNLELIYPFPLSGRGKPAFSDVNKDGRSECLVLSSAREINAWNLK